MCLLSPHTLITWLNKFGHPSSIVQFERLLDAPWQLLHITIVLWVKWLPVHPVTYSICTRTEPKRNSHWCRNSLHTIQNLNLAPSFTSSTTWIHYYNTPHLTFLMIILETPDVGFCLLSQQSKEREPIVLVLAFDLCLSCWKRFVALLSFCAKSEH